MSAVVAFMVLRTVLVLVIFMLLQWLANTFVLDPMLGHTPVSNGGRSLSNLKSQVCPPGSECNFKLDENKLSRMGFK